MRKPTERFRGGFGFFDAFAGSGIVSRLAKSLGFKVLANDWEPYAYILGRAFVETNLRDLDRFFGSRKAFEDLLGHLNNLPAPREEDLYIARYYAPAGFEIEDADFRTERLFYSRGNALAIDAIRCEIDRLYPSAAPVGKPEVSARELLIGLLLYEAATHTNTSGVFKACHKGFGGHGKDALKRILSPIRLEFPPLIDSDERCKIFREDTNLLVRSTEVRGLDVAYLDPPYNQHQYGSNYHLLNTIALWDKIPAPLELNEKGRLKEKAAIRKDWKRTKSDYCYRGKAEPAFSELLENLDAETILVSYSTDGIIPFDEFKRYAERKGSLSIVTNEYTKYRGGKQSNARKNRNVEFVLIIRRKAAAVSSASVDRVLGLRELALLFGGRYSRRRLAENFDLLDGATVAVRFGRKNLVIATRDHFELERPEAIAQLTAEECRALSVKLKASLCATKEEELEEIFLRLEGGSERERYYIGLVPDIMRKLAHKKYRKLFQEWLEKIKAFRDSRPESYEPVRKALERVETIARRRFEN